MFLPRGASFGLFSPDRGTSSCISPSWGSGWITLTCWLLCWTHQYLPCNNYRFPLLFDPISCPGNGVIAQLKCCHCDLEPANLSLLSGCPCRCHGNWWAAHDQMLCIIPLNSPTTILWPSPLPLRNPKGNDPGLGYRTKHLIPKVIITSPWGGRAGRPQSQRGLWSLEALELLHILLHGRAAFAQHQHRYQSPGKPFRDLRLCLSAHSSGMSQPSKEMSEERLPPAMRKRGRSQFQEVPGALFLLLGLNQIGHNTSFWNSCVLLPLCLSFPVPILFILFVFLWLLHLLSIPFPHAWPGYQLSQCIISPGLRSFQRAPFALSLCSGDSLDIQSFLYSEEEPSDISDSYRMT